MLGVEREKILFCCTAAAAKWISGPPNFDLKNPLFVGVDDFLCRNLCLFVKLRLVVF